LIYCAILSTLNVLYIIGLLHFYYLTILQEAIYKNCPEDDPIQAVLQQEVLLYCGRLIATHPTLFAGILKIRVGWILHAIRLYLSISSSSEEAEDEEGNGGLVEEPLESRSPSEIRRLLLRVLNLKNSSSSSLAEDKIALQ